MTFIKNKKKPFILIESLLAIGIIGLTLTTLLQNPVKLFKKNIDHLIDMELQRESLRIFFSLERTFKERHTFQSLTQESKRFDLEDLTLQLSSHFTRTYHCFYEISIKKEHLAEDQSLYRLMKIKLHFQSQHDKKPFTYNHCLLTMQSQHKV